MKSPQLIVAGTIILTILITAIHFLSSNNFVSVPNNYQNSNNQITAPISISLFSGNATLPNNTTLNASGNNQIKISIPTATNSTVNRTDLYINKILIASIYASPFTYFLNTAYASGENNITIKSYSSTGILLNMQTLAINIIGAPHVNTVSTFLNPPPTQYAYAWYVGSENSDNNYLPNNGVSANILVEDNNHPSGLGDNEFWVSETQFTKGYWAQVGYHSDYANNGKSTGYCIGYMVFNLSTGVLIPNGDGGLYTGCTATVTAGYHTFAINETSPGTWDFEVDGKMIDYPPSPGITYNLGEISPASSYPLYAISEDVQSSTVPSAQNITNQVDFSTAIAVRKGKNWVNVNQGNAYTEYVNGNGVVSYPAWSGSEGEVQSTDQGMLPASIPPDEMKIGGTLPVLAAGQLMWGEGRAYVGALNTEARYSSNNGIETTIDTEPITIPKCGANYCGSFVSFWTAEFFNNDIWAQVGYEVNALNPTPEAFYQVYDLSSPPYKQLYAGTAPVTNGYHTYSIYQSSITGLWNFALDGAIFGSAPLSATAAYNRIEATTEEAIPLRSAVFRTQLIDFKPAIYVFQGGSWHPLDNARVYTASLGSQNYGLQYTTVKTPTPPGGFWGMQGTIQNSALQPDEVITEDSVAATPYGFPLWGSPLNVRLIASNPVTTVGQQETLIASASGGVPPYYYTFANADSGAFITGCIGITTKTCVFKTTSSGTFRYTVTITDSAVTTADSSDQAYVVVLPGATPPIVLMQSSAAINGGQTETLTAQVNNTWSGPFKYTFYNIIETNGTILPINGCTSLSTDSFSSYCTFKSSTIGGVYDYFASVTDTSVSYTFNSSIISVYVNGTNSTTTTTSTTTTSTIPTTTICQQKPCKSTSTTTSIMSTTTSTTAPSTSTISTCSESIPPTVTIISPANGSIVSGTVNITISAVDDTSVKNVSVYIDGSKRVTLYVAPYYYLWNTNGVKKGTHTILATAFDCAGNEGMYSISVTK